MWEKVDGSHNERALRPLLGTTRSLVCFAFPFLSSAVELLEFTKSV